MCLRVRADNLTICYCKKQIPVGKCTSDVMTQTNKLECWMILKISSRANTCEMRTSSSFPVFPSEHAYMYCTGMLTESHGEFIDSYSIFRSSARHYWHQFFMSVLLSTMNNYSHNIVKVVLFIYLSSTRGQMQKN